LWEMRHCPIYSNGIQKELVTPTGAAIATTLATDFGSPPTMTLHKIGQGAGSIDLPIPNILRLWLGVETLPGDVGAHSRAPLPESNISPFLEAIAVLETQIDDLNPQAIGYVLEALLAAGALDVFTQSIGMKKSRPGILLTVICQPDKVADCEAIVFRETTTLGIRRYTQQRLTLQRKIQSVTLKYGTVRVKVAWIGADKQIINVQPEYEDCLQIARQHDLPWREVHRLALQAWHEENSQFAIKVF
jgi:pyridinium-3,5-bisthiocarboxylic acid mononucleotide nickel chelatase